MAGLVGKPPAEWLGVKSFNRRLSNKILHKYIASGKLNNFKMINGILVENSTQTLDSSHLYLRFSARKPCIDPDLHVIVEREGDLEITVALNMHSLN
jgi:hypothetical protein